jgi:hypothetical protein
MSELTTAKFHDTGISKADDFNHAALAALNTLHSITDGAFADVVNSFVISGLGVAQTSPPGMSLEVAMGLAYSRAGNKLLHLFSPMLISVAAADPSQDRVDLIEARFSNEDVGPDIRAFKDPLTGVVAYAQVFTKVRSSIEFRVVSGTPGAGVAPNADAGWMKLAEVLVAAGATEIITSAVRGITAVKDGTDNAAWTVEKASSFMLGSVSAIKNLIIEHTAKTITSASSVHGIRQGSGKGFDADLLDAMHATSAATPSTVVSRDAAGRAKVAAPDADDDIARKDTVDAHADLTSPHSATDEPTASRLVLRDSSGRAAFADPDAADDAATKGYVDAHTNLTSPHSATDEPTASRLVLRDSSGRAAFADPAAADDAATKGYVDSLAIKEVGQGYSTNSDQTYTMPGMPVGSTVRVTVYLARTSSTVQGTTKITLQAPSGGSYLVIFLATGSTTGSLPVRTYNDAVYYTQIIPGSTVIAYASASSGSSGNPYNFPGRVHAMVTRVS